MKTSVLFVVVGVLNLTCGYMFNVNIAGQPNCKWVGFWFGRRRVCSTITTNNNNANPSADYCSCSGSGDPHYKTFDGATIHFMGTCKYTLAKLLLGTDKCHFNVEIKNERRGFNRKVSYTRLVDVKVKDYVIRLHLGNHVFVNGIEKYAPLTLPNGLKVTRAGGSMLVTTTCGVMVTFDGRSIVTVKVPKRIGEGKVSGLCGSCDGNRDNDFFTATGQNVINDGDRYNLIGNSYNVPDDSDQPHAHCMEIPPAPVCSKEQMELFGNAVEFCGLLADRNQAFGACLNSGRVDYAGYLSSCKIDLCANYQTADETNTICQSLEAMARECSTNGILVNWRRPTFCPMECATNEEYKHDASGCEATCVNPTVGQCSLTPSEACVCKPGYFRSGNDCVLQSQCGCVHTNGEYYPLGAETRTANCGELLKCVFEGGRSFLKQMQNGVTCHAEATCQVLNGEHRCACKQGFTGDGVNTCMDLSDHCTCSGQGDPHYMLYDGQRIDFMGICMYTLSQLTNRGHECWFSVEVKNERRGWNWDVAWTRMIDFAIYGQKVRILSGRRVQVNGRTTYLPVTLGGGKMRVYYNGLKVQVDTDCGISVGFDGDNNVIVSVPSSLGGLLNGICGNCNGRQDDYKTKEGADVSLDRNRYNLIGMSYSVTDDSDAITNGCTPPVKPPRECDDAFVARISGYNMCGMITDISGPFRECIDARVVDPEQYFEGCKADICEYSGMGGHEETVLLCNALTAFAAICNNNGFELFWRTRDICPLECGANEIYNPAVPPCQKTCRGTMSGNACLKPRVEGCVCMPGFVLSDSECVPESECGCEDNYKNYYPVGAEFRSNDCQSMYKCEMTGNGAMLKQYDLGQTCHEDAVCGWKNGDRACVCRDGYAGDGIYSCINTKPCRCSVFGDPHYVTYDGQVVHFQGTCKYTLTQSTKPDDECAFNVEVKNENRYYNTDVSWTRMVDFEIYGIRVRLLPRNRVEIDGEEKFMPFTLSNGKLRVSLVAGKVQVDTDCGVNVMFDGVQNVMVEVPNTYANQMTGLCGNCNGVEDDYKTKEGADVSGYKTNEQGKAIGDSYLVRDDSDIPSDQCSQVKVPPGCDADAYNKYADADHCGYILDPRGPFKDCIESGLVVVEELFESCREDLCGYEMSGRVSPRDIVCDSLTSFAASCNVAGFVVMWRNENFCPMKCPAGFEYDVKVTACPPTCGEPAPEEFCDKPPKEGCQCPAGFVLNDKKCTKIHECGCTDEEGNYLPIGEQRVSDDCTKMFECIWDTKNVRSFLDTKQNGPSCGENAECIVLEGEKKCTCDEDYHGNGFTCEKITTPAPDTTPAPNTTTQVPTTAATTPPTTAATTSPTTAETTAATTPPTTAATTAATTPPTMAETTAATTPPTTAATTPPTTAATTPPTTAATTAATTPPTTAATTAATTPPTTAATTAATTPPTTSSTTAATTPPTTAATTPPTTAATTPPTTPETTAATTPPTTAATTATTTPPTTAEPCEIVADIGVIMDSSSSIGPKSYEIMKGFVKDVITSFDISPEKVRVAVETFNTHPKIQFSFDTHEKKEDIPFAIDKIHEINKGTYTHKALSMARTKLFTTARKGVPKIAVVLTDGKSRAPQKTALEAALLRQSGVTVFCIGIGNVSPNEVNGIASDPDSEHAFLVEDFQALDTIRETITLATCDATRE